MPTSTSPPPGASNGGPKSRLPVYRSNAASGSPPNLKRVNDELRLHISRLKSELEIEKAKSKQVHRDKVADIKRLKDEYDREKALAAGSVAQKQKTEHEHELKRLKESLQKEKDVEIKQIIRFKDEELKTTKKMLLEDKEFAIRELDEKLRKELSNKHKDVNDNDFKLRQEIIDFKKQKNQMEELYRQKAASEAEKVEQIRRLKEDHDKETQRVIRDARIQIARNVHELKAAQKALSEKEQQITKRELELTKVEEEKEYLFDRLRTDSKRLADSADGNSVRSEREKELHLKNVELRKSLDEITRRMAHIERENNLKRSDSKDSEQSTRADQRIKELKKRNGELVALAKKLEEKARRLQDELKEIKSKGIPSKSVATGESPAALDNLKKSLTLQRARDLAENAKSAISKDKLIIQLKERIATFEKQDSSKAGDSVQVKKLELQIQRIEKEKLKLEKQISTESTQNQNSNLHSREEDQLRQSLKAVEKERDNLNKLVDEQKEENMLLKSQVPNRREEEKLRKELMLTVKKRDELQKFVEEQKEQNRRLKTQVEDLSKISEKCDLLEHQLLERDEECRALAENLRLSEKELQKLKDVLTDTERINKRLENEQGKNRQMAKSLQNKMADMSRKLVDMQSFELECKMVKERLQDTETKCTMMQGQLDSLQSKLADFERIEKDLEESEEKCQKWERDYDYAISQINKHSKEIIVLQEAKEEREKCHKNEVDELREEITRLEDICLDYESKENDYKQMLKNAKASVKNKDVIDVYVQTSRPHTPVLAQREVIDDKTVVGFQHALESSNVIDEDVADVPHLDDHEDQQGIVNYERDDSSKADDDSILDIASSRIAALAVHSSSEGEFSREDKSNKPDSLKAYKPGNDRNEQTANTNNLHRFDSDTSDELTLSLDESDQEDFDIPFETIDQLNLRTNGSSSGGMMTDGVNHKPTAAKRLEYQKKRDSSDSLFASITPYSSMDDFVSEKNQRNQAEELYSEKNKRNHADASGFDGVLSHADKLTVFIAKYTYDPFEHSPNDDPGLELFLQAGDFVYVFGEADEDGFYTGELVNGQRGLVPSNFVEKVQDESDLLAPIANGHQGYPGDTSDEDLTEVSRSVSSTCSIEHCKEVPSPDNDAPLDAEYLKNTKSQFPSNTHNIGDAFGEDLRSLSESEADEEADLIGFSPPRKLTLERQLNSSVVLSWLPPEGVPASEIYGYAVKADGIFKQKLIGSSRTKAIVADIRRDQVYRISVHTIDKNEKESPNSVATITVGRGASAVPSDLQIKSLSPRSADLEWKCGNSSLAHVIRINDTEIYMVKPGIDRFRLNSLDPNTEYEVIVEARKSKDINKTPSTTAWTSDGLIFRTPEEGLPEPPLNVQAYIENSQSRLDGKPSLIVSWLPVTITNIGTSNGAIIKGYKVYFNNKEIRNVDWSTADYVSIPSDELRGYLRRDCVIWVTSTSSVGESMQSNVVVIEDDIVRQVTPAVTAEQAPVVNKLVEEQKPVKAIIRELEQKSPPSVNSSLSNSFNQKNRIEATGISTEVPQISKEKPLSSKDSTKGPTEAGRIAIEAATQKVKGKATVVMYDVTDSDDSDDEDESDSEEEIEHGYEREESRAPQVGFTQQPNKEQGIRSQNTGEDDVPSKEPDIPTETKADENLTLPTIPIVNLDEAKEVKPVIRISFNDLLSDDSELSAIEEETDEDLLEYNNGEDRSLSPGNTFSIEADPEVELDKIPIDVQENDKLKVPDDALVDANRTYSIPDDDFPGDTFDIEKETGSSVKKITRSSKDSLTFSSDDVVDILDKDVMEGLPDLPMDERKVVRPNLPVSLAANREAKPATDTADKHVSKPVEHDNRDEVPVKRTPAETNDRGEVANNDTFATEANSMPKSLYKNEIGNYKSLEAQNLESNLYQERSENFEVDKSKIGNNAERLTSKQTRDSKSGNLAKTLLNEVEIEIYDDDAENNVENESENELMGQTIQHISDEVDLDGDDNSEGGSIVLPKPSVHDLYNLHAGGSFDDSTLDSEPGYQPDFGGEDLRDSTVNELINKQNVNNETLTSPFIDKPLVDESRQTSQRVENSQTDNSVNEMSNNRMTDISNNADNRLIDRSNNLTDNTSHVVNSNVDTRVNHVLDESNTDNVRVFIALFSYDPITMSPNTDGVEEELTFNEGDLIKVFGGADEDGFYYGELDDVRGFVPSNMVQEVSLDSFDKINIPPPPDREDSSEDIEEVTGSRNQSGSRKQSTVSTKLSSQESESRKPKNTDMEQMTSFNENKPDNLVSATNSKQKRDSGVADIARDLDNVHIEEDSKNYRYISERESIYCLPPRRMIALYDYDPTISSPNVDSEVELAFSKGEILFVFGDMDEDGFFAAQSETERGLVPSNFLEECPEEPEEIEINMGAASPSIKSSSRRSSSSSIGSASPIDSTRKKKKGFLAKGKKIFSKLKGK